jgi:O-antigen/teichoic acid export membrane protein
LAARVLGPVGRGQLAAIQIWPGFLIVLSMAGMPEALSFFVARNPERGRQNVSTGILIALSASVLFIVFGVFVLPFALKSQGHVIVTDAQYALLLLPPYLLATLPAQALRGANDYLRWNISRFSLTGGWLLVLVGAAVFSITGTFHVTPGQLAGAFVVEVALMAAPIVLVSYRRLKGPLGPAADLVRPLTRFGVPAMFATFPQWLNLRVDQLVIAGFLPARQLGLYAVAVAWAQVVSPVLNALGSMVLPRLARERDPKHRGAMFAHASRLGILLAVIVVVPTLAVTPFAIQLVFGHAFVGSIPSALLLVIGGGLLGLNYILSEALLGSGWTGGPVRAQFIGLIVTGVTLAALLGSYGILGAAISSVAGYGTTTLWLLFEGKKLNQIHLRSLIIPGGHEFALLRPRRRSANREKMLVEQSIISEQGIGEWGDGSGTDPPATAD